MSANNTIYTGFWTNWSKGAVPGATLTLPVQGGGVLIAVLALFIQLSGGQSWRIICFVAHQLRTTPDARNGLFHQQQSTLRNNSSDIGTVWRLAKLSWTWRSRNIKSIQKSLALVLTALLHFLVFGAAGVLSSHLATLDNQVLLARNPSCGVWRETDAISNEIDLALSNAFYLYAQSSVRSSNQYVQDCLTQSDTLPECSTFKRAQLNWTSSTNAQCPFAPEMCLSSSNGSLYFDTGLIDSREDLGINSNDKNRVQYRKTATCSPLAIQGYTSSYNSSNSNNQSFTAYAAYYGPNLWTPSDWATDGQIINATYVTSNFVSFEWAYDDFSASPYTIATAVAYPYLESHGFAAIPSLYSPDRSVTLMFAGTAAVYTSPSDDPWLPAHILSPETIDVPSNVSENLFQADNPINVLGCTEQHQFCNPSRSSNQSQHCTPLQSIDRLMTDDSFPLGEQELDPLFDSQNQRSIVDIIRNAAIMSSWSYIIENLESALLADSLASGGISLPLPNNQWTLEADNWFSISMANMQQYMVNTATGPPGQDAQYTYGQANNDTGLHEYCANQIIQRTDYTNFSVLALALIFIIGGAIICVSLFVESFVGYLQLRFERGLYRQVRWQLDSTLQLQRIAFIEAGLGTWSGGTDDVPITEKGEEFSVSIKSLRDK